MLRKRHKAEGHGEVSSNSGSIVGSTCTESNLWTLRTSLRPAPALRAGKEGICSAFMMLLGDESSLDRLKVRIRRLGAVLPTDTFLTTKSPWRLPPCRDVPPATHVPAQNPSLAKETVQDFGERLSHCHNQHGCMVGLKPRVLNRSFKPTSTRNPRHPASSFFRLGASRFQFVATKKGSFRRNWALALGWSQHHDDFVENSTPPFHMGGAYSTWRRHTWLAQFLQATYRPNHQATHPFPLSGASVKFWLPPNKASE
jgi:hypothetical protein